MERSESPIYLIELLATYVATFSWGGQSVRRYAGMYTDSETWRMALIKAYSSTHHGNLVVQMLVREENKPQWKVWSGRVGSHANIADSPGRLDVKDMGARGAQCDECAWDLVTCAFEHIEHWLERGW